MPLDVVRQLAQPGDLRLDVPDVPLEMVAAAAPRAEHPIVPLVQVQLAVYCPQVVLQLLLGPVGEPFLVPALQQVELAGDERRTRQQVDAADHDGEPDEQAREARRREPQHPAEDPGAHPDAGQRLGGHHGRERRRQRCGLIRALDEHHAEDGDGEDRVRLPGGDQPDDAAGGEYPDGAVRHGALQTEQDSGGPAEQRGLADSVEPLADGGEGQRQGDDRPTGDGPVHRRGRCERTLVRLPDEDEDGQTRGCRQGATPVTGRY